MGKQVTTKETGIIGDVKISKTKVAITKQLPVIKVPSRSEVLGRKQDKGKGVNGKHKVNVSLKQSVADLAAFGFPHDKIAEYIGVSNKTLYKYYKKELKRSKQYMILNVANALYTKAMSGNVVAQIFILKTQAGWREDVIENVGEELKALKERIDECVKG